MAETTEIIKVSENTNETDPKVVFDPKFEKSVVAKLWTPQDENAKTSGTIGNASAPKEEDTRIDAIYVPLIKINSIVIPNDKLLEALPENVSMIDALKYADDTLRQGICGIADLISTPALINLDCEDKSPGKPIAPIPRLYLFKFILSENFNEVISIYWSNRCWRFLGLANWKVNLNL